MNPSKLCFDGTEIIEQDNRGITDNWRIEMIDELISRISVNAQSSICIDAKPKIYFDPFRIEKAHHDADLIFFTHPHHDHFSPEDFRKVAKPDTAYIAPAVMHNDLEEAGISDDQMVLLHPGDKVSEKGISIEAVPAYNIHKPMHRKKSGWLGYVINIDGVHLYDTGDTDDIPEGEAVQADIVFAPIGGTFTMNAKTAANFVNKIMPKVVIPVHYGTIVRRPSDAYEFEKYVDARVKVVTRLVF